MKIDFNWSKNKGLECEASAKTLAESIVKETIDRCPGFHITEITVESLENNAHEIGIYYMSGEDKKLLRKRYVDKTVKWNLFSRTKDNKLWYQYATAGDINNYVSNVSFDKAFEGKNPEDILFAVLKENNIVTDSVYVERTYVIQDNLYTKLSIPRLLDYTEDALDDNPILLETYRKWEKKYKRFLASGTDRLVNDNLKKKMDSLAKDVLDYQKNHPERNLENDFGIACWSRHITPENAAAFVYTSGGSLQDFS